MASAGSRQLASNQLRISLASLVLFFRRSTFLLRGWSWFGGWRWFFGLRSGSVVRLLRRALFRSALVGRRFRCTCLGRILPGRWLRRTRLRRILPGRWLRRTCLGRTLPGRWLRCTCLGRTLSGRWLRSALVGPGRWSWLTRSVRFARGMRLSARRACLRRTFFGGSLFGLALPSLGSRRRLTRSPRFA